MFIDNYKSQMAFVRSDEAGQFLTFFTDNDFSEEINGASSVTVSINDISDYIKSKTGKTAILSSVSYAAPYNGETEYPINTDLAASLGYKFTPLKDWFFKLTDSYLAKLM